jgi:hypothetical protein
VQEGTASTKTGNIQAILYRSSSSTGKNVRQVSLNTLPRTGIDMYELSKTCTLHYTEFGETLSIYLTRRKTADTLGRNLQEAIVAIYDSSFLQLKKIINNPVVHDTVWDTNFRFNYTTTLWYEEIDYTVRGVSLGGANTKSVKIWSYNPITFDFKNLELCHVKTRHSNQWRNPALINNKYDFYEVDDTITQPIPGNQYLYDWETRYKWSEDAQLYTEIGSPGLEQTEYGYIVFYVSESDPLDNNRTSQVLNTPRNIHVHLVNKDLDTILTN